MRAVDLGTRVALVDAGPLGGAGIFDGALSSKTLWHLAADYARACRRDRGYDGGALVASWPAVREEVAAACREAQALLARQLAAVRTPADGRGTVEHVHGRARFVGRDVVEIAGEAGPLPLAADRFLIAVGSRPRVPPTIAVDGERVLTSDQIEQVAQLPGRLAIIGAGVVGCEYATVFALFGQTRVELFDRQPRILPFEDDDVSAVVAGRFADIGVCVHRKARIERVAVTGTEVEVTWLDEHDVQQRQRYDRVLVATGRAPATAALGLEHAGVTLDAGGSIVV